MKNQGDKRGSFHRHALSLLRGVHRVKRELALSKAKRTFVAARSISDECRTVRELQIKSSMKD